MTALPASLALGPFTRCDGEVSLPGSKSIANRALLIAALCDKPVVLHNLLRSDDTERMLEALAALGVAIGEHTPTTLTINGCGGRWPQQPQQLYLGNAGTAMRPLLAVLCATLPHDSEVVLDGDARMRERPLQHLTESLLQQGAQITPMMASGYPPLKVSGGLQAGTFRIDGSVSSQYISALLMALPLLPSDSTLQLTGEIVSRPYINLTLAMLQTFGIEITAISATTYRIPGNQNYRSPGDYYVEGDASGASYWMAAAAIGGGPITIKGIGPQAIQGDIAFVDVVKAMGAQVSWQNDGVTVSGTGQLQGIDFDGNEIPDAAMTIVPMAVFAKGRTIIRNVANWRVKETDRLAAMATEACKLGACVEEGPDYLVIEPPTHIRSANIDTYDDHRIAMCFALLAFADCGVVINDPSCCAKTYPTFFSEFSRLCHRTPVS